MNQREYIRKAYEGCAVKVYLFNGQVFTGKCLETGRLDPQTPNILQLHTTYKEDENGDQTYVDILWPWVVAVEQVL